MEVLPQFIKVKIFTFDEKSGSNFMRYRLEIVLRLVCKICKQRPNEFALGLIPLQHFFASEDIF